MKGAYLPLTCTDEAFIGKALVFLIFWFNMLWIFFFLTVLGSAKGNWNTIMISAFTPLSSGLWDIRERWLFEVKIWYKLTLFPVFSSLELCLNCWIHTKIHDNGYKFKGVCKIMITLLEYYGKSEFQNKRHEVQKLLANMFLLSPKYYRIYPFYKIILVVTS